MSAPRNKHARYARATAERLGYGWRSLDDGDGYLFEIEKNGRWAALAGGPATPYALNDAAAYALARDKGFAGDVLARAGVRCIPSRLFFITDQRRGQRAPGREIGDARAFAADAAYPLFCKPVSGARGDFAERIGGIGAFEDYLGRVSVRHDAILAQPYLRGREYRVFVLNGTALFAYAKRAPSLTGDGAATVGELYAQMVAEFAETTIAPAPIGNVQFFSAGGTWLGVDHAPARGARVFIEGRANRSAGGGAEDFTDRPPEALARVAQAAARALRLKLAGVDVFDLSSRGDLSDLVVIEANANPAIETLEEMDRFDLIETIWAANFEAALS